MAAVRSIAHTDFCCCNDFLHTILEKKVNQIALSIIEVIADFFASWLIGGYSALEQQMRLAKIAQNLQGQVNAALDQDIEEARANVDSTAANLNAAIKALEDLVHASDKTAKDLGAELEKNPGSAYYKRLEAQLDNQILAMQQAQAKIDLLKPIAKAAVDKLDELGEVVQQVNNATVPPS